MRNPHIRICAAAVLAVSLPAVAAHAQGSARSMDIDLSIRSAAMGGASNAVFWGGEIDHWGNPALLGSVRGIRYEWGRTQLVPGLADDVFLTSQVEKLGAGGAGLVLSGQPAGDGVELSYGTSTGTDEQGNPTGTFESYEHVRSWGFGANALELLQSAVRLADPRLPRFSRWADVSFGMNFKDVEVVLGPGGIASTTARDWGALARLTPVDLLESDAVVPLRVDLSYGYSVLSYNDDATIRFSGHDLISPVSRHRRQGMALRIALDPSAWRSGRSDWDWFLAGFSPLVSVGAATDRDEISAGGHDPSYETKGSGVEITLANAFSIRRGHYEDRAGEIDGTTTGFAIGLPIGRFAGARYEQARFPQARNSGLDDLERKAFSVWLDPLEAWRALRSSEAASHHD